MPLSEYGFSPAMQAAAEARGNAEELPARVTAVHKERYALVCERGECYARLKASTYFNDLTEDFPTTGDFVLIQYNPSGDSVLTHTLPRRSYFARRNPTLGQGEQAVAANFDYVFIMQSLNLDFNPKRLERYLTLSWQSGAVPVVILTKADLVENCDEQTLEVRRVAAGVDVYAISAKTGVGKSSFVNALAGDEIMAVNEIREDDSKGRHTTTHRQLLLLPSGVLVIDTPGMRELGMVDADAGLTEAFADVERFFGQCRFTDCRHESEPGCAVKAAIARGDLPRQRWESYQKLQRESRYTGNQAQYLKQKQQRFKDIAKFSKQLGGKKPGAYPDD